MKNGFTLIELLAVIIILALLGLLASTSVTKIVKDSREDLYQKQLLSIKEAAEAWGADNLFKLPSAGECIYLTLLDLKEYGLIDSDVKDPRNGELIPDDLKVKITTTLSSVNKEITKYEVNPTDITGCTHINSITE